MLKKTLSKKTPSKKTLFRGMMAATCGLALGWGVSAEERQPVAQQPSVSQQQPTPAQQPSPKNQTAGKTQAAVTPKPLTPEINKGLKWLVEHQLPRGAWGQGEESSHMGGGLAMKDKPSVADTCMAALALIRAGNAPNKGEYAKNVLRAVEFVCSEIEDSDADSLYVTERRGARVQVKLGPYIDTFATTLLLPEVKDRMPDEAGKRRVVAALDKVLDKIKKNQRADGTWGGQGWATTLQQGVAAKGLNRAAQSGAKVDEKVREQVEIAARRSYDRRAGKFKAENSAGVELYAAGANLGALAESSKTNAQQKAALTQQVQSPASSSEAKAAASKQLARHQEVEKDLKEAQSSVINQLNDKQFVAGFGSNGGEEFLSYMNIGESLVAQGGDAWKNWDAAISQNLYRVQNNDGSWSGHHCITGRTFCTSAALLVLMVDRSQQPISEKMNRR